MMQEPVFDVFRVEYDKQHSASIPARPKAISRYPGWLQWAVGAMFVCAGLISAVHTIPTVYNSVETNGVIPEWARLAAAILSPLAVELAILISAYAFRRGNRIVVGLMLAVSFAVALVSNISSSIRAFNAVTTAAAALATTGDLSAPVVGVALGIGLPLIALVAGITFGSIYEAQVDAELDADRQYKAALETYEANRRSAWEGRYERWQVQRDAEVERQRQREQEREAQARKDEALRERREQRRERETARETRQAQGVSHETRRDETVRQPASSVSSTPSQETRVLMHFETSPDSLSKSDRALETELQIGHATISRARKKWLAGVRAPHSNGHSDPAMDSVGEMEE